MIKPIHKLMLFGGLGVLLIGMTTAVWFAIGGSIPVFPIRGPILDRLAASDRPADRGFFTIDHIIQAGSGLEAVQESLGQEGFTCAANPNLPAQYGSLFCRKTMLFHPLCSRGWFLKLYVDDESKTVSRSEARADDNCL